MKTEKNVQVSSELELIKQRNRRVEADKAWELSFTRRGIIAVATYFVVVLFLYLISAPQPWLTAFVPVLGYIFSTLTLSFFKKRWIKHYHEKK